MSIKLKYVKSDMPYRLRKLTKVMPEKADKAMLNVAVKAVKLLRILTATWKHPPSISISSIPQGRAVLVDGQVFKWLDKGVRPHIIRGNPLTFASGGRGSYVPATQPRLFVSDYAYINGQVKMIRTEKVNHPGIKPRKYTEELSAQLKDEGTEAVSQALEEATKQLGL